MVSRGITTLLGSLALLLCGSTALDQGEGYTFQEVETQFLQAQEARTLDFESCREWVRRLFVIAVAENARSEARFDALTLVLEIGATRPEAELEQEVDLALHRIAYDYADDLERIAPLLEAYFDEAEFVARVQDLTTSPAVQATIMALDIERVIEASQEARIPDEDAARSLAHCKRIEAEFQDVRDVDGLLFSERIAGDRYQLENLRLGMIAPDIVGEDLNGAELRLSDYRGKVVVLHFWGHWSNRCQKTYAHDRALVHRLRNEPFVLIGVNSDVNLEALRPVLVSEEITWPSFWNGPEGTAGPISKGWNVKSWPTVYVIDHEGIIRYKGVHGSSADEAVDALVGAITEGT